MGHCGGYIRTDANKKYVPNSFVKHNHDVEGSLKQARKIVRPFIFKNEKKCNVQVFYR